MDRTQVNPVLLKLAQSKVWEQAGQEKKAFQPGPAAAPGAAGGAPPGAPPGDPSAAMGGGMPPPMDPAMAGAMGVPPMDPAMMGMAQAAPQGGAGGKPKFDPLMLDYRMYNLQQQLSAIMNALNIEVPPQALIMPPGTMGAPPAEQAMPGGPMDPSTMQGGGGGAGGSAISPIEPMQGASPELAAAGGGGAGPKMAAAQWDPRQARQDLPKEVVAFQKEAEANAPAGWKVILMKAAEGIADTRSTDGNVEEEPGPKSSSPPQKKLNVPGAPGTRPATQAITAGGSKDPKSRTEAGDDLGAANKSAAAFGAALAAGVGTPVPSDTVEPQPDSPVQGAAALAAMMRSRTLYGQQQ